jgi:hypothetical protein
MQGNGGFRLVVRRGPQPNQTYDLNKDIVALGRDITNDIVINDPEVSRHHCRLTRTPTGYTLEDLGSTNGSFVNGQRLTSPRPLVNGDMIGLGETVTLGYEGGAVQMPGQQPAQAETMVGGAGSQPQDYAQQQQQPAPQQPQQPQQQYAEQPQYGQQDYGGPQYNMPPAQPYAQGQQPGYDYYDYEEEPRNNTGRWIAIGCGCLVVLCIAIFAIIGLVIDTLNLWCDVPIVPQLFNLYCPADLSALVRMMFAFI